jgi:uncharacterized protein (DUF302 family)
MGTHRFAAERVDVVSKKVFEELVRSFERRVPVANFATLTRLIQARAERARIEAAVARMAGPFGLMVLGKIDQGPLVSQLGKPKKMSVYLIGNPVLANRMFEEDPGVGLYAPLRVSLYQDYETRSHFSYDRPFTLLEQFANAQIRAVAHVLDERLAVLAAEVAN